MLSKLLRYRDKASQFFLRPHNRAGAEAVEGDAGRGTQSEPEQEPTAEDEVGRGPEKDDSEDEAEVPLPIDPPEPIAMPSLEAYQMKWAEKLQLHSRERRAKYSRLNLVPKPVPQLWNARGDRGSHAAVIADADPTRAYYLSLPQCLQRRYCANWWGPPLADILAHASS